MLRNLLVLLLVFSTMISVAPRSPAANDASDEWLLYTHNEPEFSVPYPAGWEVEIMEDVPDEQWGVVKLDARGGVTFWGEAEGEELSVSAIGYYIDDSLKPDRLRNLVQDHVPEAEASPVGVKLTWDGDPFIWYQVAEEGRTRLATYMPGLRQVHLLVLDSPTSLFSRALTVYHHMLKSFRHLIKRPSEESMKEPDLGPGIHRLTFDGQANAVECWSPDGKWITFLSRRHGPPNIFLIRPDGSELKALLNAPGGYLRSPAWSPDGEKIAYAAAPHGDESIYVINPDGTGRAPLPPQGAAAAACTALAWSPDGTRIAYEYMAQVPGLAVMNADGTDRRALAPDGKTKGGEVAPAWSPDGKHIAFIRNATDSFAVMSRRFELCVVNADGSGFKWLTRPPMVVKDEPVQTPGPPSWSPDGERIAFPAKPRETTDMLKPGPGPDVHTIRPDGTDLLRITGAGQGGGLVMCPTWSPTGERIAYFGFYVQRGIARKQLYLCKPDGMGVTLVTDIVRAARAAGHDKPTGTLSAKPVWSPDGKKLAFCYHQDGDEGPDIYVFDLEEAFDTSQE